MVWKTQMTPRASLESFMIVLKYRLFERRIRIYFFFLWPSGCKNFSSYLMESVQKMSVSVTVYNEVRRISFPLSSALLVVSVVPWAQERETVCCQ